MQENLHDIATKVTDAYLDGYDQAVKDQMSGLKAQYKNRNQIYSNVVMQLSANQAQQEPAKVETTAADPETEENLAA